jgi:PAS domain S-box-containing protein
VRASAADIDGVARELEQLVERLQAGEVDTDSFTAAVEGLRTSIEELRVAEEDLVHRADEVAVAHAAVSAERDRYEQMFGLAPDAFLVTDLSGRIEDANTGAALLFGLERRFLVGKPLPVFLSPPARRAFRLFLHDAAAGTPVAPAEYRFERRGGVPFDGEVHVSLIRDRTGSDSSLRLIVRDVTEQRQTEARLWELNAELEQRVAERATEASNASRELFEKRAQYEAVLHHLPVGVLVVSPTGEVVGRNERADELFGGVVQHVDEIASRFSDEDGRPLPEGAWTGWSLESDLAPPPTVMTFARHDGARLLLEARSAPVTGDGKRSATAFVFDDVTAQRQRDIAQRAFIVNAAHELRTPLAAIVSAIEVLQSGAKDDVETRDVFLGHIQREADRLVRLARALLVLARAQAMEEQPTPELVPLRPLLEELVAGARPEPDVAVEVECDKDAAAFTSPDLLRQAIVSVFDNALRHTTQGVICLRAKLLDERTAAVEIEDTGTGMTPREMEVALLRFVRGAESSGFGLGLAIAAEAARASGGELTLESEAGHGTTATITVPAAHLVAV